MRGLPFPSGAVFNREESHEYGSPTPVGRGVPIDPALGVSSVFDPSFLNNGGPGVHTEAPDAGVFWSPSPSINIPKYSQGPQGDPFAPPPPPIYFPIEEEQQMPIQKPAKRRRKPRREMECGFCQGDDSKNREGEPELMVSCDECGRSGHASCMELGAIGNVLRNYPWKCIECKNCEICQEKGDDSRILFCDNCDRGWHMDCLNPPFKESPPGKWHCPMCPPLIPEDLPQISVPSQLEMDIDPALQIDPALRESSVASSSHSYFPQNNRTKGRGGRKGAIKSKGKGKDILVSDDSEDIDIDAMEVQGEEPHYLSRTSTKAKGKGKATTNGHETPRGKGKGRPRNLSISIPDDIPSPSPELRPPKRMRLRISSPYAEPPQPRMVVRLRIPAKGKGKAREEDDDDEPRKGLFDDVLSVDDRDTTKTTVFVNDKDRFERSRVLAEEKLVPPPPPPPPPEPVNNQLSTPGPSLRSTRSTMHLPIQSISGTPRTASPTPSTPGPSSKYARAQEKDSPGLRIRTVRFGLYDIQTWYDAPFPEEFSNIPEGRLWMCEYCLKYMKSRFGAQRHRMKCKSRHPPGDEIYRDGNVSIFEVDGRKNKIYCQNLCLLSKMFLDHKSLFYDVEPFLFYVMTEMDDLGAHFVGYFSKEKHSPKDFNVSCIMTLPVRQRKGWGNLLIDFSYLLSKKEQRTGTPERPLSGLGALGYKTYWTLALMRYLQNAPENPRLEDISLATSMTLEDIHATLLQQDMIFVQATTPSPVRPSPGHSIKINRGRKNGIARRHLQRAQTNDDDKDGSKTPTQMPTVYDIRWDKEKVEQYLAAWERKGYMKLKPERLKWTPFLLSRTVKADMIKAKSLAGDADLFTTSRSREESSVGDVDIITEQHISPIVTEQPPSQEPSPHPTINGLAKLAEVAVSVAATTSLTNPENATTDDLIKHDADRLDSEAAQLAEDAALAQELANSPLSSVRSLRSQSRRDTGSPASSNSVASEEQSKKQRITRSQPTQFAAHVFKDVAEKDIVMKSPVQAQVSPARTSPRKRRRVDSLDSDICSPLDLTPAHALPRRTSSRMAFDKPSGRGPRQSMRLLNGGACESPQPLVSGVRTSSRLNGLAPTPTPSPVKPARVARPEGAGDADRKLDEDGTGSAGHVPQPSADRDVVVNGVIKSEDPDAFINSHSAPSDDTVCPTPDAAILNENENVPSLTVSPIVIPRDVEYVPAEPSALKQGNDGLRGGGFEDDKGEDVEIDAEGEDEDAEGEPDTELEM